jgi:HlyD family secretion protein
MKIKKGVVVLGILAVAGVAAVAGWVVLSRDLPDDRLFASGTVEATEVALAFRVPGVLAQRPVDEGQQVKTGQLLAVLDDREAAARLSQAQAAVRRASANHWNLADQAKRSETLFDGGAVSQEQRDRDVTAANVAAAQLKEAEAAARVARVTLEDMRLASPIDAVVTRTHAEVGETVAAGRPVVTLTNLDKPWVRVYVPETVIGRVRLGGVADITVDSFPDRVFKGRVTYIASQAEFTPKNVQTQEERVKLVFAVDVTADNPDGTLKPGMPADVVIATPVNGR